MLVLLVILLQAIDGVFIVSDASCLGVVCIGYWLVMQILGLFLQLGCVSRLG